MLGSPPPAPTGPALVQLVDALEALLDTTAGAAAWTLTPAELQDLLPRVGGGLVGAGERIAVEGDDVGIGVPRPILSGDVLIAADERLMQHHLAVRQNKNGTHPTVRSRAHIETRVERTVAVQTRHAAASCSVVVREISANNNFSILLQTKRKQKRVGRIRWNNSAAATGSGIKCRIQASIGVNARNSISRHAINTRKKTANHNFVIGLQSHGANPIIRAGVKTLIHASV